MWGANYSSSFAIPGGLWVPVTPFLIAEEQSDCRGLCQRNSAPLEAGKTKKPRYETIPQLTEALLLTQTRDDTSGMEQAGQRQWFSLWMTFKKHLSPFVPQLALGEKALGIFRDVQNSPLVSPGLIWVPMLSLQWVQGHVL